MIEAHVVRDSGGRVKAFRITGHAGAGEYGNDIVCAAVSILAWATVNGLRQRLGLKPAVRADKRSGDLECRLPADVPSPLAERAQDLLETMVLALRDVAGQQRYRKYVRIIEVTVP